MTESETVVRAVVLGDRRQSLGLVAVAEKPWQREIAIESKTTRWTEGWTIPFKG
jgi:hypothetical protein